MITDVFASLAQPYMVIVLLVSVAFGFGIIAERFGANLRRQAWKRRGGGRWKKPVGAAAVNRDWSQRPEAATPKVPDAADQLRVVMGADFSIQPLLNKSEARVFKELDRIVIACRPGWQVMAQVSVGEILRSKDAEAYRCINSKRVDLLIVDEDCRPRHAIEYQGSGHHQGTAAARDAVKKEALRRAGIGYHEVVAGHTTPSELKRLVERLVAMPAAA